MAHNPLRLVYRNFVDSSTSLIATSSVAEMPVSNLYDPKKYLVWRTDAATTVTISAEFAVNTPISFVGLLHTNVSPAAVVQVQLFLDGSTVADYDSGQTNSYAPNMAAEDQLSLATYMHEENSAHVVRWVPYGLYKRAVITITDPCALPYLQASTLLIGPHWEPTVSADLGATVGVTDLSQQTRTEGGSLRTDRRPRFKTLKFSLSALPDAEASELYHMLMMTGLHAPVFVSAFPENESLSKEVMFQLHGKMKQSAAFSQDYFDAASQTISMEAI